MTKRVHGIGYQDLKEGQAYRVRLPGFIAGEDIGLGEVVKRATSYLGIRPCDACQRRADALNRRLVFATGTSKENR